MVIHGVGWFIDGRDAVSDGSYVARLGTEIDGTGSVKSPKLEAVSNL